MKYKNTGLLLVAIALSAYGQAQQSTITLAKPTVVKEAITREKKVTPNKALPISTGAYTVQPTTLNSKFTDFAPAFYKEGLVFSTARDTGRITKHVSVEYDQAFSNLYEVNKGDESTNATKFTRILNTKAHESSATFSKDGTVMYFTRNNFKKGFKKDKEGKSRLQILKALFVDGKWGAITSIAHNNESYSVAHPALNKEGTKLYFASDMPGTYGESDIFSSDIANDGSLGVPVNMGPIINSNKRETFPFVADDNRLYFASDGHNSNGGLDVFVTNLTLNGEVASVLKLDNNINSVNDDFSFIINSNTKQGYFASNRNGGMGSDDIYMFEETTAPVFKEPLKEAKLLEEENKKQQELAVLKLAKENSEKAAIESIVIYYGFDKTTITDEAKDKLSKIAQYLKSNPEKVLNITSHTDARGDSNYNTILSEKRAAETKRYLVENGISESSIRSEGLGETALANDCKGSVRCTADQHAVNRRTTFKID